MNQQDAINGLRALFSKATLRITNKTISASYNCRKNGFFRQTFDNEKKDLLSTLAKTSKYIKIKSDLSDRMTIVFGIDNVDGSEFHLMFPPIERDLSIDEIKALMATKAKESGKTREDIEKNIETISSFVHDWKNSDELFQQLGELFSYMNSLNNNKESISFRSVINYDVFKEKATELMNIFQNTYLTSPKNGLSGCAEFSYHLDTDMFLHNESKDLFEEMIAVSSELEIEGDLKTQSIIMTFFS